MVATATLPEAAKKLLTEGKNFAYVASKNRDGSLHVTPVWVDYDGKHVIFTTEQKRLNPRNMRRDPAVALAVANCDNAYSYVEIRGRVVDITPDGAFDHIDKMSEKYTGNAEYQGNSPGDVRLLVRIEPEYVTMPMG
jgi:PPOX class probable F420-dependent enzyme